MALPKKKSRQICVSGTDYRWGTFVRKGAIEIRVELSDGPASQLVARIQRNTNGSLPTIGPGLIALLIKHGLAGGWVPDAKQPREWQLDDIDKLADENDLAHRKSLVCLVIAPFDAGAQRVRDTIARTVRETGAQVRDAADAAGSPSATASISDWISEANIVIADVTRRNPNTFYEVGFAHALGKPTILLVDDSSSDSVPESLSGNLFLTYGRDNLRGLQSSLKKAVLRIVRSGAVG